MNENEEYLQGQRDYVLLLCGALATSLAFVLANTWSLMFNLPQMDLYTQISITIILVALTFVYHRRYNVMREAEE